MVDTSWSAFFSSEVKFCHPMMSEPELDHAVFLGMGTRDLQHQVVRLKIAPKAPSPHRIKTKIAIR
jgi:hypothetical protein